MDKVASIALAVISLATVAVLITNGQNTANVIAAGTGGFAKVLATAMGGTASGVP